MRVFSFVHFQLYIFRFQISCTVKHNNNNNNNNNVCKLLNMTVTTCLHGLDVIMIVNNRSILSKETLLPQTYTEPISYYPLPNSFLG